MAPRPRVSPRIWCRYCPISAARCSDPNDTMANLTEVKVPDIGDFKDVEVIEVLVKPGDKVEKEASLISLESDKATMEIPSSDAGVVKELKVKVGDKVNKGSVILTLEAGDAAGAEKPAPA